MAASTLSQWIAPASTSAGQGQPVPHPLRFAGGCLSPGQGREKPRRRPAPGGLEKLLNYVNKR